MKLTIRRARAGDIGALREMSIDFVAEVEGAVDYPKMDEKEVDEHMLELLASIDNPDTLCLIAYDGKKPAGFFTGYVGNKPYSQPRRVAVAQELYVVPEKRSGIVGLRLMEEAGLYAIERGAEAIECAGTFTKQEDGSYKGTFIKWEKFGFKPHVTYGHMDPEDYQALVTRFTKGRKAA